MKTDDHTDDTESDEVPKKKAKNSAPKKAGGARPTAFLTYCKTKGIDCVKARRALRAAGLRDPGF